MKDSKIFKLVDFIGDIEKADEMINLHNQDGVTDCMLSQYQAKKY